MFLSYIRAIKINLAVIPVIICFICILYNAAAFSQSQIQLPDTIKIGIRTIVPVIGKYRTTKELQGFCGKFVQELGNELRHKKPGVKIEDYPITNDGIGEGYQGEPLRYHSLIGLGYHIQCGSNSKTNNVSLIPHLSGQPTVIFSEPFYKTGIKLLIKKSVYDQYLLEGDLSEQRAKVQQEFSIGAEKKTTTIGELKNAGFKIVNDGQGYQNRDDVMSALENDKVHAVANDAIILRHFYEDGYKGKKPYKAQAYVLFPQEAKEYLIPASESYAIAISNAISNEGSSIEFNNQPYSKVLKEASDRVVKKLQSEQTKLQNYEDSGKNDYEEKKNPPKHEEKVSDKPLDITQLLFTVAIVCIVVAIILILAGLFLQLRA